MGDAVHEDSHGNEEPGKETTTGAGSSGADRTTGPYAPTGTARAAAERGDEAPGEEPATSPAEVVGLHPEGVGLHAEGFGLDGPRGRVFSGVGFEAAPGSLVALEGPSGSGRTCLLLALTGRMKATGGHAVVGGRRLPGQLAAVRRFSALAAVPGVTDLEPSLSVAEHLRERVLLQRRFGGSLRSLLRPRRERAAGRARVDAALALAGFDPETLPKGPRTRVGDLERLEVLRLSVALALLGAPRLLAVDDADFKLPEPEREEAWALLRSVAACGVTVLAVCSEAPPDAVLVRTDTGRERQHPAHTGEFDGTSEKETADALAETGRA
ncbi:ATP-binding cassette domain-containing protein [Streptomyces sp. WMMB 322]|uniref:ATP-binding cassette domain-containing protein n=1 Tax=Streptomyces sp. WMMB 322 TaxID=1286821 RepID=UPI0020C7B3C2|nr:ATP-binding cassette domain-containing protein [Streptomyces sp. WMMB 322]